MAYPLLENALGSRYYLNGQYISSNSSEADLLRIPSDKVTYYETVRIIDGILLFLEEHLGRLSSSVKGIEDFPVDLKMIEEKAYAFLNDNGYSHYDGNLRIVLTSEDLLIYVSEGNIPSEDDFRNGINTLSLQWERVAPNIKVYRGDYKKAVADTFARENEEGHPYEVLLTDNEGRLYEGSKSNLFVIIDGQIYSAPDDKILLGITRKRVMNSLEKAGAVLNTGMFTLDDIRKSSNAAVFVSSTPFDILPVRRIDDVILDSVNDPLLQKISESYREITEEYIKDKSISKR